MTPQRLDPKTPNENLTFTFDFSQALVQGESITNTYTIAVTTYIGVDASASSMISGAASVNTGSGLILQNFAGGLPIIDYLLSCKVTTSLGRILEDQAILPVR
ncbi:hypothetical protein [Rhodoferax sp. GW822-FHT02A01]|uniref:phage fiber-tail adaptor protein n=1 Tax=Rhodoferax sp. GW822-FHT02A01 TaxID=3141537 RepID=UPI00315DC939